MTAVLSLADGWDETRYESGTYGPEGTAGLSAAFGRDSMALRVHPVRYECVDGTEQLRALDSGEEFEREGVVPLTWSVDGRTAFATVAEYEVVGSREREVVCVAADAGDALAAGLWLAEGSDTDRGLRRALTVRNAGGGEIVTDDNVLATLFADHPERCLITGQPTRSHELEVPYRYYPFLDGAVRNRGIPRIPSTIRSLVGVVSHSAWEEHGLEEVAFDAPIEREGPGEYHLDPAVADLLGEVSAEDLSIERLR